MEFVDLEAAKRAKGLRLVLIQGVPSPWSQAAKAIVELDGVDALGVWMLPGDAAIAAFTGVPNGPVAMYAGEPARTGWGEILALAERLSPEPRLVPRDLEQRVRLFGLANELMAEGGVAWNWRLLSIDASVRSGGARGFPLPVARYLGARYGYTPECASEARERLLETAGALAKQLRQGLDSGGAYYFGRELSALDVYSTSVLDALVPLSEADCPMRAASRAGFEALSDEMREALGRDLLAHRDRMHRDHIPLPLSL